MTTVNNIEIQPIAAKQSNQNINSHKIPVQRESDTTRNVLIGAGLAALAAAGIYIATRGKGTAKSDIVTTESQQQLKELTLAAFKKEGAFSRGKAVLNNGENFSGTIITKNKKLEYKDGVLQSSVDKNGDKKTLKQYFYDNNGNINKIVKDNNCLFKKKTDGDIMTIITENRSIQKDIKKNQLIEVGDSRGIPIKSFYYDETTGNLRYIRDFKNNTIDVYRADGKTLEAKIADKNTAYSVYYDENGDVVRELRLKDMPNITGAFDYKNAAGRSITRRKYTIQGGKKVQIQLDETTELNRVRKKETPTNYSYMKKLEDNSVIGHNTDNEKELWDFIQTTEGQSIGELKSLYRDAIRTHDQTVKHLKDAEKLCPNRTIDVHFEVS